MEEDIEVDYSPENEERPIEQPEGAEVTEDIYGDLYDAQGEKGTLLKSKYAALQEQCQGQEGTIQALRNKIEDQSEEIAGLSDERKTLIRNISCIYRTAKEELARKDAELKRREVSLNNLTDSLRKTKDALKGYREGARGPGWVSPPRSLMPNRMSVSPVAPPLPPSMEL